jgi:hypothetical protein
MAYNSSKMMVWIGRIVSTLPVLLLLFSATLKIAHPPMVIKGMSQLGYTQNLLVPLAITEISCTLIYIFPPTAILGAILLTGYLGGATASHLRAGQPFIFPALVGVLVWVGLYLRDSRIRTLIPIVGKK